MAINEMNNKGAYILSIEAGNAYEMSVRGLENIFNVSYTGLIPYSLELIKLRSYKRLFAERQVMKNGKDKYYSDAIINIKFKGGTKRGNQIPSSVGDHDKLMKRLQKQCESMQKTITQDKNQLSDIRDARKSRKMIKKIDYLEGKLKLVQEHIERINNEHNDKELMNYYKEMKPLELRTYLYKNGFWFKGRKYVFYKRTASKSRQSQALFILEDLEPEMKKWSRMGLEFNREVDLASLMAYESLVSSSIEETIEIDSKNIFIIDDQFSIFEREAIEIGDDLKPVFNEKAKITNNIWDGQGLIDISLMNKINKSDKGMILTRQHFWKSCLFNTKIQGFLEDKHKEMTKSESENYNPAIPKEYDKWKLKDMFGKAVFAKDILVVTTPSSLKFLKYGNDKKKAFVNFKKCVKADGNLFGICKSEKQSKYGDRSYTSYQMINTLSANREDIASLASFEIEFIKGLQGISNGNGTIDEKPFIDYLNDKKDISNAYEMFAGIYEKNNEVVRTKIFRDYRAKQISNYKTKVKGGKLRLLGDYCTVVSNPYEMLEAILGIHNDDSNNMQPVVLKGNEIYTKLHRFNEEYTVVRNPHNAMHNFYKVQNVDHLLIGKYFCFSENIVVINSIKNEILDRCNGMDMDSDTILIFKDAEFNRIVDKTLSERNYPIILNRITSEGIPVEATNENMAEVDYKTAQSQRWIGAVTNAAQYQVSLLWDLVHGVEKEVIDEGVRQVKQKRKKTENIQAILENLATLVVLSNVAIDYSKKVVNVDIDKSLKEIKHTLVAKRTNDKGKMTMRLKPTFWKYVTSSTAKRELYNCPMEYLSQVIDEMKKAPERKNLSLADLLVNDVPEGEINYRQIKEIESIVNKFDKKLKEIKSEETEEDSNEKQVWFEEAIDQLDEELKKRTIKPTTMYKILFDLASQEDQKMKKKQLKEDSQASTKMSTHILNALYRSDKKAFLNLFKSSLI